MQKYSIRKTLACGIILLFIGTGIPLQAKNAVLEKEDTVICPFNNDILYVGGTGPGNYSTIQSAINVAHNGYTIFVYHKSVPYSEELTISVSINLIGENKNTTIIQGRLYHGNTVSVYANSVNISGFTIQSYDQGNYALYIRSNNNTIVENIVSNAYSGAVLESGSRNSILRNTFYNNYVSDISLEGSSNTTIVGNDLPGSRGGLSLRNSNSNIIEQNTISNCDNGGLFLENSSFNLISFNSINFCYGLRFGADSSGNNFCNNTVMNTYGINIVDSSNNIFFQNNIIQNTYAFEVDSAANTEINDNIISFNSAGILIRESVNITVNDNNVDHGRFGVALEAADQTTIQRNIIHNTSEGITISSSNYCRISQNEIYSDAIVDGLSVYDSAFLTITNNIFMRNGINVNPWSTNDWNSIIIENNSVNGKPIVFLKDKNDIVINDAGQMILVNCARIMTQNQNFSDVCCGVVLINSTSNILKGNSFTDIPSFGLFLFSSNENTLQQNTIIDCTYNIYFISSDNNLLAENLISSIQSESYGIIADGCSNNGFIRNTFINTGSIGVSGWNNSFCDNNLTGLGTGILIYGESRSQWISHTIQNNSFNGKPILYYKNLQNITIPDNIAELIIANCSQMTIDHHSFPILQIGYSSLSSVTNNSLQSYFFQGLSNSTIADNTINASMADRKGMSFYDSQDNTIVRNNITNSDGLGLWSSSRNRLIDNVISDNIEGILIGDASSDNYVTGNLLLNNHNGMFIQGSTNDDIVDNVFSGNRENGLWIQMGSTANITRNTFVNNSDGIYVRGCVNIPISYNTFVGTTGTAINLYDDTTSNISVFKNIFKNNNRGICLFKSTDNNIEENTIINSSSSGIRLDVSANNTISENSITNATIALDCYMSSFNSFSKNTVNTSEYGFYISGGTEFNEVYENIFQDNIYGIYYIEFWADTGNRFFHNNLIENQHNAYVYDQSANSYWDNGYPSGGNYWSDYTGVDHFSGPNQNLTGSDGIGDTPYNIPGGSNQDFYPLMEPWSNIPSADVYVDNDASPGWYDHTHVRTIQEGINNATTGDTIFVYDGLYPESITVNKTLTLLGEDPLDTFIDMNSGPSHQITAANVTIQRFTFKNTNGDSYYHGVMAFSNDVNISNNIFQDCSVLVINCFRDIIYSNTFAGESLLYLDGFYATILDNIFEDGLITFEPYYILPSLPSWNTHIIENNIAAGKPIVYYKNTNNIEVPPGLQVILANCTHCILSSNFGVKYYIQLGFSSFNSIQLNTFEQSVTRLVCSNNNTIIMNSYNDSLVEYDISSNNTIVNNTFSRTAITSMYYCRHNSFKYNIINNSGLDFESDNHSIFIGNSISNGLWMGINFWYCSNNTIENNSIVNSQADGVRLVTCRDFRFFNNTITNNGLSGFKDGGISGIEIRNSRRTLISGNNLSNNVGDGIWYLSGRNSTINNNIIRCNGEAGINLSYGQGNNTIFENNIKQNHYGIYCSQQSNAIVYHNNFLTNIINAYDHGNNHWNLTYPNGGNYWSDYTGTDGNGDGIGDTPYNISGGNNQDLYPLMHPWPPLCGDINADGTIDIGDVVYLISYLFRSGSPPQPLCSGDCNSNGIINIGDVVVLINYLYKNGPAPSGCC